MANCSYLLHLALILTCVLLTLSYKTGPNGFINMDDVKSHFGCRPCDLDMCAAVEGDIPSDCVEVIPIYPLCPCCMQCARQLGEQCGFKNKCGRGLECRPVLTDEVTDHFEALSSNSAMCVVRKTSELQKNRLLKWGKLFSSKLF